MTRALFPRLAVLLLLTPLGLPATGADDLPLLGAESPAPAVNGDQAALSDLLAVIEDASTLATKTRMNADFVPGILSVLHGDELVALGARTAWEALALVPGLQVDRNNNGGSRVTIRGLMHGNGNVKLLLNSVPMNNAYSGYSNILSIPVEQVERIEVIRGPGSAVHGEFAFAGVINIITRKNGNHAYLRAGGGDTHDAGAVLSAHEEAGDWRLSLNLSGWDTQGTEVMAGADRLYGIGLGALSQSPGIINNAERYGLAVVSLEHGDFSLLAQRSRNQSGTFFGALNVLPEANAGVDAAVSEHELIQARQGFRPSDSLDAELQLSLSRFTGDWAEEVLPSGVPYPFSSRNLYPDGVFMEKYVRVDRQDAALNLDWRGWRGHRWQLGLALAHMDLDDAWWEFNGDPDTLAPLPEPVRYTGDRNFIDEGASRTLVSLVLQDQFRLGERVELTAGLRHDDYSDAGDNLSPRLAAVWSLTDEHLLKAQYAEAFFPPTLIQVHTTSALGTLAIDPETIATRELGYIFRRGTTVARVTLYHSKIRDLIVIESSNARNHGRARLRGVEAEWEQRLGPALKLLANLSHADTRDEEIGGPLVGAADWVGNLGLLYRPHPDVLLTGYWRYVSDRHRSAEDPRDEPLPSYHDLDLTLNWFNVGAPGLTLRAGVKNLLGETIQSPALAHTYDDDYPLLEERTWWAQLSYRF